MIKKLLMAIVAIAMPIGTATAVGVIGTGTAGAAAPAATTTVHCTVTGSVVFQKPGISLGGSLSKNTVIHTKAYTTPAGTGCPGTTGKLVIPSATTLCPETNSVPDAGDPAACLGYKIKKGVTVYDISTKPYYYNTSASYASSGVSDLVAAWTAKPPKVVMDNIKVVLAVGTATQVLPGGACGSYAGFEMTGTANTTKGQPVGPYDDLACITNDTGTNTTGDFATDITTAGTTVATAILGGNSYLDVTFGNGNCAVTGSVVFQKPGISLGGSLSKNTVIHTKAYTTPTGTYCPDTTGKLVIPSATTLCPETNGVPDAGDPGACLGYKIKKGVTVYDISTKPYYYNTSASYATTGLSDLIAAWTAKPPKVVIDNIKVQLAVGTASQILPGGVCGSYAGFEMSGTAMTLGRNPLPIGPYDELTCLTGDSGTNTTGDFATDITTAGTTVATATLGGNSYLYVTFQP